MSVKIIYVSTTGNTEEAVGALEDYLKAANVEVTVENAEDDISPEEFFDGADHYVIASYTDGDGEIPDGFLDFYDDLEDFDLAGKSFAVIGSGDTFYDDFCKAVDLFEERLTEDGGTKAADSVKFELAPDDDALAALEKLAKALA
jgi:flavodoxin I